MTATVKIAMILRPHNTADGTIDQDDDNRLWSDERVPSRIDYKGGDWDSTAPAVIGYGIRPPGCEDGRHLFDVIESSRYVEGEYDPDTDKPIAPDTINFNARLTCVRCGFVEAWEGTRKADTRNPTALCPTPIRAGDLAAQEINGSQGYGRDTSEWAVHDATGAAVGVIVWASGKRGRAFFQGRLFAWPEGETVEGTTPIATLRKIAARPAVLETEPVAMSAGA